MSQSELPPNKPASSRRGRTTSESAPMSISSEATVQRLVEAEKKMDACAETFKEVIAEANPDLRPAPVPTVDDAPPAHSSEIAPSVPESAASAVQEVSNPPVSKAVSQGYGMDDTLNRTPPLHPRYVWPD